MIRAAVAVRLAAALVLSGSLTTVSATGLSVTYDFNGLAGGNLGGQDNWVSAPMGNSTTQQHEILVPGVTAPSRNTAVVGHDGSKAARMPYGGASITSRSMRVNDASFDFSSVVAQDQFTIEFDLLPPCWGCHFYLGPDGNGDGDLLPADAGFRLIAFNGCSAGRAVRVIAPDGTTTTEVVTANVNDLYRYRLCFNRTSYSGAGSVRVDRRNVSTGGAWVELTSLQELRMDFTSDDTKSDPTSWDTMGILSDLFDPPSLFDNITFTADESCLSEWGPSWAQWASGGLGGPV